MNRANERNASARKERASASARTPAVIDNRNGTFTVLRCYDKEENGYRAVKVRYPVVGHLGHALQLADAIQGRK